MLSLEHVTPIKQKQNKQAKRKNTLEAEIRTKESKGKT